MIGPGSEEKKKKENEQYSIRALDANEENSSTGHFRLSRELTIPIYLTHTIFNFHAYMVGIDPMHSMSGKTCGWMIVCPHNCETS